MLFMIHLVLLMIICVCSGSPKRILYLPLDERFTTRDLLLNLGKLTSFIIETPSKQVLSKWKTSADLEKIDEFIDERVEHADLLLISAEMYLYGGLIASRISNDTTIVIEKRLEKLILYRSMYPNLDIYVSNVVQRIPSYNGDFEEPWYWEEYGEDLYTYSYFTDKYSQTSDPNDQNRADEARQKVPASAVNEFLWRRERNHNITMTMLHGMTNERGKHEAVLPFFADKLSRKAVFNYLYTTLDDSAEYGFNIREAAEINDYIATNEYIDGTTCPVYPGADEVHATMLAKYAVQIQRGGKPISISLVFKNESTVSLIPSYEGQPMIDTLTQQIVAAGGVVFDSTSQDHYDTMLLVNNFEDETQLEASEQPIYLSENDLAKYSARFDTNLKDAISQGISNSLRISLNFKYNLYLLSRMN